MSYHPSIGRFLQRDPIGYNEDGMNQYQADRSNPLKNTDPRGLQTQVTSIACADDEKVMRNSVLIVRINKVTLNGTSVDIEATTDTYDIHYREMDGTPTQVQKVKTEGSKPRTTEWRIGTGDNPHVTKDTVEAFVSEWVLPDLPAWFHAPNRIMAAAGPNNFSETNELRPKDWIPGKKREPTRYSEKKNV